MTARVDLSDAFREVKIFANEAAEEVSKVLKEEVIGSIERGVSPVKRQGRFDKYSDSYTLAIDRGAYREFNKRRRPVNLKLSGELLKSFFINKLGQGRVELGFDNFLADIHNRQGAGESEVVRRMLPTEQGEQFTDSIQERVGRAISKVANRIFG